MANAKSNQVTSHWTHLMTKVDRAGRPEIKKWYYEQRAKKVIESLGENYIKGYYVPDRQEAFSMIMGMIPKDAIISYGDSITLYELGIISELSSGKYNFINPWEAGIDGNESLERRRRALLVDVLLAGVNAITLDGKIINIDGLGNRVAGLLFGPKKVIIVVGVNKITKNEEEGIRRIKNLVAPMNARRHGYNLPCAITGFCVECKSSWRICNKTVIIERDFGLGTYFTEHRVHVIIVGENLGL